MPFDIIGNVAHKNPVSLGGVGIGLVSTTSSLGGSLLPGLMAGLSIHCISTRNQKALNMPSIFNRDSKLQFTSFLDLHPVAFPKLKDNQLHQSKYIKCDLLPQTSTDLPLQAGIQCFRPLVV